jgi:hypothetical protein
VTDLNKQNSAIYIDGKSITNDSHIFIVHLRPGTKNLVSTNFKLFHYDEDLQISSHFWYPLQPSFWFGDRMVPALLEREVAFPIDNFPEDLKPASVRVDVIMNRWYFKELHAGLKSRLYYDPSTQMLGIRGFINDKTLGDDTLTGTAISLCSSAQYPHRLGMFYN